MDYIFTNTQWQDYADEHILLLRHNDSLSPSVYECVKAVRDYEDDTCARFSHMAVFIDDYINSESGIAELDRILPGFGYEDLTDFVNQTGAKQFRKPKDASKVLDWIRNDPDYVIDMWLLVSLICESHESGILMSAKEALDRTEQLTGLQFQCIG